MSKILRRPMFRNGGKVNSRGTGITSGLDTPKRGLVDGPGGYAGKTGGEILRENVGFLNSPFYQGTKNIFSAVDEYGVKPIQNLAGMATNVLGSPFGYGNIYQQRPPRENNIFTNPTPALNPYLDQPSQSLNMPSLMTSAEASQDGVRKETVPEEDGITNYEEDDEYTQSVKDQSDQLMSELQKGEFGEEGDSDDINITDVEDDKSKAERLKAEFEGLLGIEKARTQDISDMLLRFSAAPGEDMSDKIRNYLALESKAGPSRTERIQSQSGAFAVKDILDQRKLDKQIEAFKKKGYSPGAVAKNAKTLEQSGFSKEEAVRVAAGLPRNFDAAYSAEVSKNQIPPNAKQFDILARGQGLKPLPNKEVEKIPNGTYYKPGAKTLVVVEDGKFAQIPY